MNCERLNVIHLSKKSRYTDELYLTKRMYLKIEYILYKLKLKRGEFYVIIWRCIYICLKIEMHTVY